MKSESDNLKERQAVWPEVAGPAPVLEISCERAWTRISLPSVSSIFIVDDMVEFRQYKKPAARGERAAYFLVHFAWQRSLIGAYI